MELKYYEYDGSENKEEASSFVKNNSGIHNIYNKYLVLNIHNKYYKLANDTDRSFGFIVLSCRLLDLLNENINYKFDTFIKNNWCCFRKCQDCPVFLKFNKCFSKETWDERWKLLHYRVVTIKGKEELEDGIEN